MADIPTLFSTPMVKALLAGQKTTTRRVVTPQPVLAKHHEPVSVEARGNRKWVWMVCNNRPSYRFATNDWKAHYEVGDRLWVREPWIFINMDGEHNRVCIAYQADEEDWPNRPEVTVRSEVITKLQNCKRDPWLHRKRLGRFMFREFSRLTLTVTEVKIEQVQNISLADSIAEGVQCETCVEMGRSACHGRGCWASQQKFRDLWDSLNRKRGFGWDQNPWVAAYSFTVHHCNIDQMEKAA